MSGRSEGYLIARTLKEVLSSKEMTFDQMVARIYDILKGTVAVDVIREAVRMYIGQKRLDEGIERDLADPKIFTAKTAEQDESCDSIRIHLN